MKSLIGCLSLPLLLAAFSSHAAQTNGDFDVSATVARACTITQLNDLNFGEYDPLALPDPSADRLDTSHTMSVKCTAGSTGVRIDLSSGSNPWPAYSCLAPRRHMMGPGGKLLRYYFYKDAGRTAFWGCNTGNVGNAISEVVPAFTDSLNAREFTIYSRVYGGQDVPAGSYNDVINVGVTF